MSTSKTDTISYWVAKAYEDLAQAQAISEATGEEFGFSLGNTEISYVPDRMTKEKALSLLASGRALTEAEKTAIRVAIENDTLNDDDWQSSNTGWVTSSDLC